ncbi:MAG TPA: class I SAM-dependent methyltransferase [Ktedonobacteraceae bacterium]|nr:class I SAM-dependent methyltransferase [Ktedonobacteraceae bacterium]
MGDRLGLYQAMASGSPVTSQELAARTGLHERYVREWLLNQTASGYVEYDPARERYTLPPEHALALTDTTSPAYVGGLFYIVEAGLKAQERIAQAFRTGNGLAWGDQAPELFPAVDRLFKPGYAGNLVQSWIPALEGVQERLQAGANVADVGCGYGASTILMALAFPNSRFFGFDSHAPSIEAARRSAEKAGVSERITFEVASAQDFPGTDYALVAFFDCLHDMGDPIGAIAHVAEALAPEGSVLIVEPMAAETIEGSVNPVARLYSAGSIYLCTPNAISSGEIALGNQVPEQKLREIVQAGGLSQFRRATETPFNRIFEARK